MKAKRSYNDPCGLARALDMVGERWALLVVRELLLGPKRFRDLARGLTGMSENVLSARLGELEDARIVRRRTLGPPVSARVYELTDYGAELELALLALARWGSRIPTTVDGELSTDALMLALKTTFVPGRARGFSARIELQLPPEVYKAEVSDGLFNVQRGAAAQPTAILSTDPATLGALTLGGRRLETALAVGDASLQGDPDTTALFLSCFPQPATVDIDEGR